MSSLSNFSQKKKREAVRRLSQGGRGTSGQRRLLQSSMSLRHRDPTRRRKSDEDRGRGVDESGTQRNRRQRQDEGKRHVSPMNNPELLPKTSGPLSSSTVGGLFGNPRDSSSQDGAKPNPGFFGQISSDMAVSGRIPAFSQPAFGGSASSDAFNKTSTLSSMFGNQPSSFGLFGAGSKTKTQSLVGQKDVSLTASDDAGIRQPHFKVTFGSSAGSDEAGTGQTLTTRDSPDPSRQIITKEPSSVIDSGIGSGLFGKPSPQKEKLSSRGFGIRWNPTGSGRSPRKRNASPSKSTDMRRPLLSFDDTLGADLTDLETFGSGPVVSKPKVEKESLQKRAPVKRSRLLGRALEDASGVRDQDLKRKRGTEGPKLESSRSQKLATRFASRGDIQNLTTIICKDVPDELNNRIFLTGFFEKYGKVRKVNVNPRKTMATVFFYDHESAAKARKEVKALKPGARPVAIFWGQKDKSGDTRQSGRDENISPDTQPNVELPIRQKKERPVSPFLPGKSVKSFYSAVERYEALEERDKQIRKGRTKQSDLATAKKMMGTCPDMCPEKERYMREVQRRLSPYEMIPGTDKHGENPQVDHTRAVKEYSRSSADQEEPLSSELRHPHVLDMTMNYLMGYIMDREDGRSWADWFDFLWNRTRSIRKEITQQQLCGTVAVSLMEKCARFHIYCAYCLCEEGMRTFDPKINNENLTKCLQSLKQFYHDLANEGFFCPNEAEFRAYEVLLNMSGGDILIEVQQYRIEVRNSDAVVFAIKAFAAFSSNNYCRFFKLIRSATFLNACILHRYFVQVRSKALETMNKAFARPRGVTAFPINELVNLLAFEDGPQASSFSESHGLAVADDCIQFSSNSFFYPEEALTSQRAPAVIEAKHDKSVGEVVNGGPLPIEPIHVPSSSFNDEGRLTERSVDESRLTERSVDESRLTERSVDERSVDAKPPEDLEPEIQEVEKEETKPKIPNEMIKEVTKELFLEVIDDMIRELSSKCVMAIAMLQNSPVILSRVVDEELGTLSRQVAMETINEAQQAEELKRAQEKRVAEEASRRERRVNAMREEAMQDLAEEIVSDVLQRSLGEIARHEINAYQQQLECESMERSSVHVSNDILDDVISSEVTYISGEVIKAATEERDRHLAEMAEAIELRQLGSYFQKWQRVHVKRVKIRRALETFPAAPPNQTPAEQLQLLWPNRLEQSVAPSLVETDAAGGRSSFLPLCLDTPYSIINDGELLAKKILHHHYLAHIRHQRAWSPLDLPSVLQDNLNQSHDAMQCSTWDRGNACLYWKLVVSLPPQSQHNSLVCDWLTAKLRRGKISEQLKRSRLKDNENVETLSLYTCKQRSSQVGICAKTVTGHLSGPDTTFQLKGSKGLILALQAPIQVTDESSWHDARERFSILLSRIMSNPPVPILVCVFRHSEAAYSSTREQVMRGLDLKDLVDEFSVSAHRVIILSSDVEAADTSQQFQDGLAWLASQYPQQPTISSESLKEYLDSGLSRYFSTNLYELAHLRRESGQHPLTAEAVVSLYNSVIAHLGSVASSELLAGISWPPAEFTSQQHSDLPPYDWNTESTLEELQNTFRSLELPDVPGLESGDWSSVCQACLNYVTLLPEHKSDKATLLSRIKWLLDKCRRSFEATCFMTFGTEGCQPTSHHAPWSDILEECVSYKISSLCRNAEREGLSLHEQRVYYFESRLDAYELPSTWLCCMNRTLDESIRQHDGIHQSYTEAASERQSILQADEERDRAKRRQLAAEQKRPDNESFLLPEDSYTVMTHTKKKTSAFRTLLMKEKQESMKFEALLSSVLDDPMDSIPLGASAECADTGFRLQLPPMPKVSQLDSRLDSLTATAADSIEEDGGETLSQQINSLKQRLASEKQAGLMAELRLNALLGL